MLTHGALVRLCRARDLLRDTHDRTLTIEEVARDVTLSPFHFIRVFRAVFGETPHQFRIQARVDRAKQLLALSDYSVTDVCMEVGFTQREQERIARDERLEAKEAQRREKASRRSRQQRAKDWQKWRRALSPSRQLARIKGGVKQIFLPRRGGGL
jgi:AraC-like DNA-binding protein